MGHQKLDQFLVGCQRVFFPRKCVKQIVKLMVARWGRAAGQSKWGVVATRQAGYFCLQAPHPAGLNEQHAVGPALPGVRVARVRIAGVDHDHHSLMNDSLPVAVAIGGGACINHTERKLIMGMGVITGARLVCPTHFNMGQQSAAPEKLGGILQHV